MDQGEPPIQIHTNIAFKSMQYLQDFETLQCVKWRWCKGQHSPLSVVSTMAVHIHIQASSTKRQGALIHEPTLVLKSTTRLWFKYCIGQPLKVSYFKIRPYLRHGKYLKPSSAPSMCTQQFVYLIDNRYVSSCNNGLTF